MKFKLTTDLAEHVKGTPLRYHHGWKKAAPGDDDGEEARISDASKLKQVAPTRWESATDTQDKAQKKATLWYSRAMRNEDMKNYPSAQFWEKYQEPGEYEKINEWLRNPKDELHARALSVAKAMFSLAGVKTTKPIKLYRGLRSQPNLDWTKQLQVGKVFQDNGMVSTTGGIDYANPSDTGDDGLSFAQSWLTMRHDGQAWATKPDPGSVVMEIHVPPGTTVVGGSDQFIETMLPPGSKFKIISQEQRTASPRNPTDSGSRQPPFTYTHVIAELQP